MEMPQTLYPDFNDSKIKPEGFIVTLINTDNLDIFPAFFVVYEYSGCLKLVQFVSVQDGIIGHWDNNFNKLHGRGIGTYIWRFATIDEIQWYLSNTHYQVV